MKTRFIFLLLAAVLLGSMSAFAQNDNGEPLKGDVNGDDVVDVADVVAVLQIMKEGEGIGERQYYVSIGTTPVTASNFKVVNNATQVVASSYERQYDFTPSGTDYVYVLVADDYWVSTITNQSSNMPVDFSIVTDVEISGYRVYRTDNKVSGKILVNIEHVIYYWYVGTIKPTSLSEIETVSEYQSEVIYTNNSGAKSKIYVVTDINHNVTFYNPQFNTELGQIDVDVTTIPGCKIYETEGRTGNTGTIKIVISKIIY